MQIDVERCDCGGRFKLRALVLEPHNIERLLRPLGEPLEPPRCAPARDPPYFKSQGLRLRDGRSLDLHKLAPIIYDASTRSYFAVGDALGPGWELGKALEQPKSAHTGDKSE